MTGDPRPHVLLVEDDPTTVTALRHLLTRKGAVVDVSTTCEEALAAVGRKRPDVIALDLKLAGEMDGFEALKRLKTDSATSSIPVVVVTNFGMLSERERAKALGADGFMLKADHSVHELVERLLHVARHGVDEAARIW